MATGIRSWNQCCWSHVIGQTTGEHPKLEIEYIVIWDDPLSKFLGRACVNPFINILQPTNPNDCDRWDDKLPPNRVVWATDTIHAHIQYAFKEGKGRTDAVLFTGWWWVSWWNIQTTEGEGVQLRNKFHTRITSVDWRGKKQLNTHRGEEYASPSDGRSSSCKQCWNGYPLSTDWELHTRGRTTCWRGKKEQSLPTTTACAITGNGVCGVWSMRNLNCCTVNVGVNGNQTLSRL